MKDELTRLVESLLSDIEAMQRDEDTFGGFGSGYTEWGYDGDETFVEWPNLAITAKQIRDHLNKQ